LYVGGGIYDGVHVPTMLAFTHAGCYTSSGGQTVILPAHDCVYLVDDGNYSWVRSGPSHSGSTEVGAVEYHGVPVGRGYHPNPHVVRIGKVVKTCCMYYAYGGGPGSEYSTTTFEVLVYNPWRY
jgi:hypothetical protein